MMELKLIHVSKNIPSKYSGDYQGTHALYKVYNYPFGCR